MPIIECTIKRPRVVTFGDTAYKFQPDDQGRFVADVDDREHASRLLDIRCYRRVKVPKEAPAATASATAPEKTDESGTQQAPTDGQVNPLVGQGLGSTIAPESGDEEQEEGGEGQPEELDRAKLAEEYEAKFGKKPHHSQNAARIKQLLDEEQEED